MLRLSDKVLPTNEQVILDSLQNLVDAEAVFLAKAERAKVLWGTKGNVAGKRAFEQILNILVEMCVSVKTCNYCEQNEANDIEHIFPKSFFPEMAFRWENYLLACKQCNSGYKLDKCFVIDENGEVLSTVRGEEPRHKIVALINPRIEDPNNFLWLNTAVWQFEVHEDLSHIDLNKAIKTLEILELNSRDYLIKGREVVHGQIFDVMDRLSRIIQSDNIQQIEQALAPYHNIIDTTLPINDLKEQIIETTKQHIFKLPHPSVWNSIKTISGKIEPRWIKIFQILPYAHNW